MATNPAYLGLAGSLAARPRKPPGQMQSAAPFRSNDVYQHNMRGATAPGPRAFGGWGGAPAGIDPGAAAYGPQGISRMGGMGMGMPAPAPKPQAGPVPAKCAGPPGWSAPVRVVMLAAAAREIAAETRSC